MFQDVERHEMKLVETHDDGSEEWVCPTCHRRFVISWPPNYKRVILEEGDENAIHAGGKGGVRLHATHATESGPEHKSGERRSAYGTVDGSRNGEPQNDEESGLSPIFLAAINELDFDALREDHDDEEDA
jgi:hypothetical protein